MSMNTSVFEMVHQVLGDAKEKLAADRAAAQGVEKTAAASQPRPSAKPVGGTSGSLSNEYLGKLASACDHLASNLHRIDHQRSPQEKLAEAVAINQALMKSAFEGGDVKHQTTQANADSISPMTVAPTGAGTAAESSGNNAIPSEPAMTPGTSLDAGESGQATAGNQPPKAPGGEKANPQDPTNAFETNLGMMMPEQPEDLLKQPGGEGPTGDKTAAARALRTLGKVTGRADEEAYVKMATAKKVRTLLIKAAQAGIPQETALAMMGFGKQAEDAINPASVAGPTKPVLQQEPGVPSAITQGSEAGSNTPRETAPNSGEGAGRELLTSNESAMNATKGQAKKQNKGALSELLTEPMHASATDKTLQESLDNTSAAGVKISAARELLRKVAANPNGARKIAALVKLSLDPEMAAAAEQAAAAEEGGGAPPEAAMGEMPPEMAEEGGVTPEAVAAAEAGVTPEELAEAEALLEEVAAGEAAPEAAPEAAAAPVAPEAGAEEPEKTQQMGMGGMGGMGMAGAAPTAPMPL